MNTEKLASLGDNPEVRRRIADLQQEFALATNGIRHLSENGMIYKVMHLPECERDLKYMLELINDDLQKIQLIANHAIQSHFINNQSKDESIDDLNY